jgi:hypothetical protein
MEFKLTTDLSVIQPSQIGFNYDELKTELTANLEKYRGLVVTDDSIADAKKARAKLNALGKAINDEKIATKKQWNAPLESFITKCGILTGMVDEVSSEIDKKVKELEDEKKGAKKASLLAHFTAEIGSASEYVTFEDIFDPKWLNATVDEEAAKEQITEIAGRYKQDVEVLASLETDIATRVSLENRYRATKNISDVLRLKKEIEERSKAEIEARRQREEARLAMAADQAARSPSAPENAPTQVYSAPEIQATDATGTPREELLTLRFEVTSTRDKLTLLKQFLKDNGIKVTQIND